MSYKKLYLGVGLLLSGSIHANELIAEPCINTECTAAESVLCSDMLTCDQICDQAITNDVSTTSEISENNFLSLETILREPKLQEFYTSLSTEEQTELALVLDEIKDSVRALINDLELNGKRHEALFNKFKEQSKATVKLNINFAVE